MNTVAKALQARVCYDQVCYDLGVELYEQEPAPTLRERVLKLLGGLFMVAICAFMLYIIYPTFGRYLEVRALPAGSPARAELLSLEENPLAYCQSRLPLGGWERCRGTRTAYTVLTLEHAGARYTQRYFPSRLVEPLGLRPGLELRVVQSGGRLLVDERAYGYEPLPAETLRTDLWIILTFSLPLAIFWWFSLNIDRLLYSDS